MELLQKSKLTRINPRSRDEQIALGIEQQERFYQVENENNHRIKTKAKVKHKRHRAGFYFELPAWLGKKGVLRIDNKDEYCFKYAVCACLHPSPDPLHPRRHTQYEQFFHLYNWKGMNFPVGYRDMEIFERNNPNIIIKSWKMENMDSKTDINIGIKIYETISFSKFNSRRNRR